MFFEKQNFYWSNITLVIKFENIFYYIDDLLILSEDLDSPMSVIFQLIDVLVRDNVIEGILLHFILKQSKTAP